MSADLVTAVVTPRGPYRLRLMVRTGHWRGALGGGEADAWQRPDGRVVVRAPDEAGLALARFMLALDDDTGAFHARFDRDRLVGPSARALVGYRPLRVATVAHAVLRAFCGQLIDSRRARTLERRIAHVSDCGPVATRAGLAALAPAELRRHGLAQHRASSLVRLVRTLDVERLRERSPDSVFARLARERGIGPWSVGVIALDGLGRYDRGLVGDLGLMKLASALYGHWVEPEETAALLAAYEEWQGLAGEMLMLGWGHGLVAGANAELARSVRVRARAAA